MNLVANERWFEPEDAEPEVSSEGPEDQRTAPELASLSQSVHPTDGRSPIGEPPELAHAPDILTLFAADVERAGLAGEQRLAKLVYLALTSRLLPWGDPGNRPVSLLAKGTSSSGKSYTTRTVLSFFPESAYLDLGSMSKRYLLYTEEQLAHRIIVIPEYTTIANDEEIISALRTLLSEGRLIHGTVEGEGKRTARKIDKQGPTGLLMTTTAAAVDGELETRCISVLTDDTPVQTRRIFRRLAQLEQVTETTVDHARWQAFQSWLAENGETRIRIPYIHRLGELVPVSATRLRRDFVSLLCLVRAHALVHQQTRDRDDDGRIVATLDDYTTIRALVADLFAEAADAAAPAAVRETVEAVSALLEAGEGHVSVKQVADKLGVGRQATYDRVRRALAVGYLTDIAPANERGKKLVTGAKLPGEEEFLPTSEAILRSTSDSESEDASPVHNRGPELGSDPPTSPTIPAIVTLTRALAPGEPGYALQLDAAFAAGLISSQQLQEQLKHDAQLANRLRGHPLLPPDHDPIGAAP